MLQKRKVIAIVEMKHIQGSGFNFHHQMGNKYLSLIKEAVHAGTWEQLCLEWFICTDDSNTPKTDEGYTIKKFTTNIKKENQLDRHFIIKFENSKVGHVKLSTDFLYQFFTVMKKIDS